MVNESIASQPVNLELATFGEVLYAFSALRSTSGRRRGCRVEAELLPWPNAVPGAPIEFQPPQAPKQTAAPVPKRVDPPPKRQAKPRRNSGRCECGVCRTCLENARWERIFREKFASSEYYDHEIRIRYASPLSGI
jgi:hypothetical protein